ncbi:cytochrome c3 family protein, partial [filamentous cyanobacterium LEGE 11480]
MAFKFSKTLNLRTVVISLCLVLIVGLGSAFAIEGDHRTIFLPGPTSNEHQLFEASCESCHDGFKPVSNDTCNRCHQAELKEDIHGKKKFLDPRWAEYRERMDVLTCTACHNEHVHIFSRGVHLQADLCMTCHEGVIKGEMKSHDGFAPDGCWTAGCHNFHDHRAISTGFLRDGMGQPAMLPKPELLPLKIEATEGTVPDPNL